LRFPSRWEFEILKVPSQPSEPAASLAAALREVRAKLGGAARSRLDLTCGTTVGTNALLERRGGRTALVTTKGFEDVLEIGRQARPKLYDLLFQKPEVLVPAGRRIGAAERVAADGSTVTAFTSREIRRVEKMLGRLRPQAVAICFLFSFRNPSHESALAKALRRAGYLVSVSHEILPEFREFERTSTTVINAYLAPVMSSYLRETESRAASAWRGASRTTAVSVRVMQSNGGIISAARAAEEPVRTVLSGPAGGILGAGYAAGLAGLDKVLSFDMGGTSTDVALLSGETRVTTEARVAGLPVAVPMLEIHTVGPEAAPSPVSTPVARCGWVQRARARTPARSATARATCLRLPMPTRCSAISAIAACSTERLPSISVAPSASFLNARDGFRPPKRLRRELSPSPIRSCSVLCA
jgi:N-methylhydantoinase A